MARSQPRGSPGRGGTRSTPAGRACRDRRSQGWEPTRRGISTGSMSGGPVPAPGVTRLGRHRLDPRRSSLSRPPQPGLGADASGISTGSMSGCLPNRVSPGLGPGRRSSSLSRCPVGSAPSPGCGGLDRLDRRGSSRCLPGRVSRAGTGPPLIEPAGVEPVPPRPGEPGLGPGHRSSSLSRCPSGRLPALPAVVSTGSTGGGRAGAFAAGESGLGPGHRSSSLSRCPVGSAPSPPCGDLDTLDRRGSGHRGLDRRDGTAPVEGAGGRLRRRRPRGRRGRRSGGRRWP